jgi:aerobic-type carbon monoxide dehydrogenase small subunit (CoxS/CutS family)
MKVDLVINGEAVALDVEPTTRLVDVLRHHLALTGTKDACGRGDCGACTVLVGDRAVLACLTLVARVSDKVSTIEGLAEDTTSLREAMADHGGLQCGYCTPGLVVRCSQLPPGPKTRDQVRWALAGNFCRCTGYTGIVESVIDQLGGAS